MRKGTCKHFTGTWHNKKCEAGVNYRELVGGPDLGWVTRLPCHKDMTVRGGGCKVNCDKYEEPSKKEIAESEKVIKEAFKKFQKTIPLIEAMKKEFKDKSGKKTVKCPECGKKLTMTITACNGHVWGKCETKDCLCWME